VILVPEPKVRATIWPEKAGLHVAMRDYRGARYMIAVNPLEQPVAARIAVPGLTARRAEVLFERRGVETCSAAVEDRFESFGVHVYRFE
jgi:hypothetical protein